MYIAKFTGKIEATKDKVYYLLTNVEYILYNVVFYTNHITPFHFEKVLNNGYKNPIKNHLQYYNIEKSVVPQHLEPLLLSEDEEVQKIGFTYLMKEVYNIEI